MAQLAAARAGLLVSGSPRSAVMHALRAHGLAAGATTLDAAEYSARCREQADIAELVRTALSPSFLDHLGRRG